MAYRGPAYFYQIRRTTINNKTGDSFAITIPRIIADQFSGCYFKLTIEPNRIIFESGCKREADESLNKLLQTYDVPGRIYSEDAPVRFN